MAVQFSTADYQFSHGHAPRGRGSWAFFFDRNAPVDDAVWVHNSSYADAKKVATVVARSRGVRVVYLGS